MNLTKINEDIRGCEGVLLGDEKALYVEESEVLRLILKYAYNIEYEKPPVTDGKDFEEEDQSV